MKKSKFIFLILLTTSLMGSSFSIGKLELAYLSPLLLVALRFILAGAIMGGVVIVLRRTHPKHGLDWLRIAVVGSLQTAGVMGGAFVAMRTIGAGETSVLTFTNPLFVVILSTMILKVHYTPRQWMGVLLGLLGVFITLGADLDFKMGTALGLASGISFAVATILVNRWRQRFDLWVLSAYQMLFGGLVLLVSSFLLETPRFVLTAFSVGMLLWLAVMASIVQFAVWFYLLQQADPGKVSAFLFLAPLFGVLSGWLILQEPIHVYMLIGAPFIFGGIFMTSWSGSAKRVRLLRRVS